MTEQREPYGYFDRKLDLLDEIRAAAQDLDPAELRRVLKYIRTLSAEQKPLFDDSKKCLVCGNILYKPKRGPWPKFCSTKCKQKHYRDTQAG